MDKRPLKVFLCHASTDKPKVRELYRYLKRRGINPWFDEEDLVGGQDWQVEIPKALATSDAIIICLTKNSIDREGYIQKEIKFALDKALEMPEGRIFLIPVKFEECEAPFSLSRYQWVDLTVESGYAKMMKALKFRASQLERSTVEVSKKDVEEENHASEKKEREVAEFAERERKEKELREKQKREISEKDEQEKRLQILQRQAKSFEENNKLDEALKVYLEIEKIDPFIVGVDQKIVELQKKIRSSEMLLRLIKANNSHQGKSTQNNGFSRNKLPILAGVMGIIFCITAIILASLFPSLMQKINTTPTAVLPSRTSTSFQSITSTFTFAPLITKTAAPNLTLSKTSTPIAISIATDVRPPDTYILKEGEWINCIARRFDVDLDELLKASELASPDIYYAGLTLIIPQGTIFPGTRTLMNHPATYTVASGNETIYSIACKFGDVFPEDIAILNGLLIDNPLSIGQKINIP